MFITIKINNISTFQIKNMLYILNVMFKNNRFTSLLFIILFCSLSYAQFGQNLSGPSQVNPNSTHTYTYDDGTIRNIQWSINGGVEVSTSQSLTQYSVVVQWGEAGSGGVTATENKRGNIYLLDSRSVTKGTQSPAIPNPPTVINYCNTTRLTRGNPPTGIIWYWQETATGTSTQNSEPYVDRITGTVYYLRAYNTSTMIWSTARAVGYTVTANGCNLSSSKNYIYTLVPRVSTTDVTTLSNTEKKESVTYFDGLGRSIQSIAIRAGGNNEDIITHMAYDVYGRQNKKFLPYALNNGGGGYKADALTATNNFYNTEKYENTLNPYNETIFDKTPLNLVLEQAAPGNDWNVNNEHTVKNEYKLVETADNIRRYSVTLNSSNTPALVDHGTTYTTATQKMLYKFVTKNENWVLADGNNNTTHTFKDYRGRTILNRQFENGERHDTYYVYDHYGNLTYVLPPKAEATITMPNSQVLAELCYQYKYDLKNRIVEKKTPGKGWEYIVYDKLDRPVMTQDAKMRINKQWLFTKYETFGRPAYSGMYTAATAQGADRETLQSVFNNEAVFEAAGSSTIDNTTVEYTNTNFPSVGGTSYSIELHAVYYYDTYNFNVGTGTSESAYGVTPATNVNGLETGSKIRVLGVTPVKWITSVSYYDEKSRPIYVYSHNDYLGTTDKVKSEYDFVGNVLNTNTTHLKNGETINSQEAYTYDHMDRLKQQSQRINSAPIAEVIVDNTYDELGRVTSKGVGGKTTQSRLQTVDLSYTVRGWLKQINDIDNLGNDLFSFEIGYNTSRSSATPLYNGNISETLFRTNNTSSDLRGYAYNYDALNRLKNAKGIVNVFGTYHASIHYYNEGNIEYDKNGNLLRLDRKADGTPYIDRLFYTYDVGNKLLYVDDNWGGPEAVEGFKDENSSVPDTIFIDENYYNSQGENWQITSGSSGSITHPDPQLDINLTNTGDSVYRILNVPSNTPITFEFTHGIYEDATMVNPFVKVQELINGIWQDVIVEQSFWDFNETNSLKITHTFSSNQIKILIVKGGASDNGILNTLHLNAFKVNTAVYNDYGYDINGNMTEDKNKGITSVVYNHLNLPTQITTTSGNIQYIYDAAGTKLKKTISTGTTIEYANGYIYENNTLKVFPHAEGYVEPNTSGGFNYAYQYVDNVGNIRLTYMDSNNDGVVGTSEILEENNYYPFGLKHKGYNENVSAYTNSIASKFKYNGIELEEGLGINLYEMNMRQYDATIARWTGIDPVTHHSMSTYTAFDNNPVYWADPSGANSVQQDDFSGRDQTQFSSSDINGNNDCCNGAGDNGQSMTELNTLDEVVLSSRKKSKEFDFSNMPDWMKYQDNDWWESSFSGSLRDYNRQYGTNFSFGNALNEWTYQFYYKPAYDDMINDMHSATSLAAEIVFTFMPTPLVATGIVFKGGMWITQGAKYTSKYIKPMLGKVTKTKGGFTKFQLGFRNSKTGFQLKLERHGFNNKVGSSIYTTHINYGKHGKEHYFLNVFKRNKTADYAKEYIYRLGKFKL